ncbi:MAG: adenosylcobinamide-GDP ribazoletransferase, partial [Prevotella sp.]
LLGAGLTVIPIIISGGIHMDGLADVIDAQSSHANPERKREILKDPHVGAFAIIGVGCYLLSYFGFACEVHPHQLVALACTPVISRCLSGFATVTFRPSKTDGMFASESRTSSATRVRILLGVQGALAIVLLASQGVLVCLAALGAGIATLACVHHVANRDFGGMSGDLAGFFLQMAELAMLVSIVVAGRLALP